MSIGFGTTLGVGSTDKVVIPYTTAKTVRSYSIWYNRHGTGGGGFGTVFRKDTAAISTGVTTWQYNGSVMTFSHAWSTAQGTWTIAGGLTLDTWFHVLITYDGSAAGNNPIIYLNGVSVTVTQTVIPTGANVGNAATINIGNRADNLRNWDGKVMEVGMWNRVLTADEAVFLAKGGSPAFLKDSLEIYWPGLISNVDKAVGPTVVVGTKPQDHLRIVYPNSISPC